jgi:hypothetical protein
MGKLGSLFLYWVTLLALFISITGFLSTADLTARIFQISLLPITIFLTLTSINHLFNQTPVLDRGNGLKRLMIYYCFIVSCTLVTIGFFSSTTLAQFISAAIFSHLAIYFLFLVWPRSNYVVEISKTAKIDIGRKSLEKLVPAEMKLDVDRRDFLKLVGTAGVLAFIFGIFSKKSVSFFNNTPAITAASLIDPSGKKINPAQQSATDNYSISEIDDSTPTAYFGFINEHGQWYIMKEDASGAFRYVKGDSNFESNWVVRDGLNYDYFNNVF